MIAAFGYRRPLPAELRCHRARALAAAVLSLALGACGSDAAPTSTADAYDPAAWYDASDVGAGAVPAWDAWNAAEGHAADLSGPAAATGPAVALPCGGASVKPDGSCCPAGQGWDQWTAACVAFALAECPDAATCRPRWCATWPATADCQAVAPQNCLPQARACSAAELSSAAGCRAGELPSDGGCRPAGSAVQLPYGATAAAALPQSPTATLAPPSALRVAVLADGSKPVDLALCLPGDTTPIGCAGCAVSQAHDASGTCAPLTTLLPEGCPQGFVADAAAPSVCAADLADCPSEVFADVADEPQNWFVDPAFGGLSTGRRAAPFVSLQQALAVAGPGSTIALAAGSHALPKGESVVAAGVALRGRCAALTTLQLPASKGDHALIVQGAIQDASVAGGAIPLVLSGGGQARRVVLSQGSWAALRCAGCTAQQVVIHGPGRGVVFDPGFAQLNQLRIYDAVSRGIELGAGVTATLDDVAIWNTQPSASGGGYGILASEGAQLSAQRLRVIGAHVAALGAYNPGTAVVVSLAELSGTAPSTVSADGGHGALSSGGASVALSHARLQGNHGVGALAWGKGSLLQLSNTAVVATLPAADQGSGDGVRAQNGGRVVLRAVLLQHNRSRGAFATGAGSQLDAERVAILDTLPRQADQSLGMGLGVEQGAQASAVAVRLQGNRSAAVQVSGAGSQLTLQNAVIVDTLPRADDGGGGYGVEVGAAAKAQLQDLHVNHARSAAVWVSGAAAQAQLSEVWLTQTDARASDQRFGRGLVATAGAAVGVSGLHVLAARDASVSVQGATLTGQDLWLDATLAGPDHPGVGMQLSDEALVQLRRLRLSGHSGVALAAAGTGTAGDLAEVIIDADAAAAPVAGAAVQVSAQALLTLRGLRLDNPGGAGLLVADKDSQLHAVDAQIDSPSLAAAARPVGAMALGQAKLSLTAAVLRHCRLAGVAVDGAQAVLNGVAISQTESIENGTGGAGLQVQHGNVHLWGSQLAGNHGAGVAALASQVELQRSAITATPPAAQAGPAQAADGLLLVDGLEALIKDSLVAGHGRVGVLLQGGSTLAIGLAVSDNTFAWCLQGLGQLVTNAASLQGNLQNVWTGPPLTWFMPAVSRPLATLAEPWAP